MSKEYYKHNFSLEVNKSVFVFAIVRICLLSLLIMFHNLFSTKFIVTIKSLTTIEEINELKPLS